MTRELDQEQKDTIIDSQEHDQSALLSSFTDGALESEVDDIVEEVAVNKDVEVDDRLIHEEQEDGNMTGEVAVAGSSNQVDEREGNNNSSQFDLNYFRNNFNFLDRIFQNHQYSKLPTALSGPNNNDGVFNNLSAKPDLEATQDSDKPPTYEEAAADATPPYWETSVLGTCFSDEVFVDGLPVGNLVNFMWNLMASASFQFVGFLVTYILHTSHAAKQGSRAGLGVTFISYGYYMIPNSYSQPSSDETLEKLEPENPNSYDVTTDVELSGTTDNFHSSLSSGVDTSVDVDTASNHGSFIAYIVIGFGVFIFIKALVNYHRAKQMERVILQPPSNVPVVAEV